jgi:hypothetical protein
MNLFSRALPSILVLIASGCAHAPFKEVVFEPLSAADRSDHVEAFQKEMPAAFEIMESAVFNYRGKEMAALSYTKINENNDMLAIASFTPSGVELAQLKFENEKLNYHFNLPKMDKQFDEAILAEIMASDIRHIYFDRVPPARAQVIVNKKSISYAQIDQENKMEWVFAGPDTKLYQKKYFHKGKLLWNVRYFSYQTQDSLSYPSEIYYENNDKKYTLSLRLKEVLG